MSDPNTGVSAEQIAEHRQNYIGRLIMRANRIFSAQATEKLHARGYAGLSLAHTTLLINLDTDGTRITTLAERAGMTKQSMGQLVIDLARRGYVECVDDPQDKRVTIVKFTAVGWQFLRESYEIKREVENDCIAILGEENFRILSRLLTTLIDASDPHKPDNDHD